jgi:hypothetical protein
VTTFARLSAEQFIIKLHESSSCTVAWTLLFQEFVLTVFEDDGKTSYYLGPDPRVISEESYKAFQISVNALWDKRKGI